MSLDLGAVVGRVVLEDVEFQRTYVRVTRQMADLGTTAERGAAGTGALDEGLGAIAASAGKASTSLGRATRVINDSASADQRAAAAATRYARATTEVTGTMDRYASTSARTQQAALRQLAAQDKLAAAEERGTASTRELASAQAGLIGASERVTSAQAAEAAAVEKSSARSGVAVGTFAKASVAAGAVIGYEALKQAGSFQQATNVYVTAAGESVKNLGTVRAGIEGVAKSTGTSIDQLTAAEYVIEKAGDRGASGIKLLTAAAQGAREENANLSDVVNAGTSIMASYHLSTAQSVQVINALKTGAGQAKVTMEEYSKSLSTVIPVASAAGISLGQTLGAISTLTQHGTSAAEATQELASTIRNLEAPNNVATKAMQQLGLSATDVSKNLGRRGLTGTIDLITNAIASKMGPSGLVAVSAFKKSQSASADLRTELDAMPASLAKISSAFASGKMSYSDYYSAVKGLGGQQYELGKSFISTMGQAKGFNDLLKSGSPAAQTFVSYLKRITGGAIGMNTALQLGGQNLDGFQQRTAAVNKSLHDSAASVEGWSSTQHLFSVSADRAKESIQVLAIELGDHLLPIATQAMEWFAGPGVHDLEKFAGVTGDVLTVVGHVLSDVFGFISAHEHTVVALGGAFLGLWAAIKGYEIVMAAGAAIKSMTLAASADFGAMGTSVRGFGALITGNTATVAAAAAQQEADFAAMAAADTQAASEQAAAAAVRERGWATVVAASDSSSTAEIAAYEAVAAAAEESAATTAAAAGVIAESAAAAAAAVDEAGAEAEVGWSDILGPLALVAAAATGVVAALHIFGGATKSAVGPEDDLTAAILKNNGALGTNVRALTAQKLEQSGAYDAALKLGISQKTLTDATLGNKTAQEQVSRVMSYYQGQLKTTYGLHGQALKQLQARESALKTLQSAYTTQTAATKASEKAAANEAAAQSTAGKNDKARAEQLGRVYAAQKALASSYQGLNTQVGTYGTTLDQSTKAGKSNASFLQTQIDKANAVAKGYFNAGGAIGTVTSILGQNTAEFRKQAVQAGFNETQIDALIKTYQLTPKQIVTNMLANISKASASAKELQKDINSVKQGKVPGLSANSAQGKAVVSALQHRIDVLKQGHVPSIDVNTSAAVARINSLAGQISGLGATLASSQGSKSSSAMGHHARGGPVRDGFFTVGEQGYELGYKRGSNVQIFSNPESQRMTGMSRVPGFAAGTSGSSDPSRAMIVAAARAIASAIAAAIRPAVTGDHNLAHVVTRDTGSAVTATASAAQVGRQYAVADTAANKLKKQLTDLRIEQRKGVDALRAHATALGNDATKAEQAASAMPDHTKAEKAAKDAADKHAQSLRNEATAQEQLATKSGRANAQQVAALEKREQAAEKAAEKIKTAWGKAKDAAQAAEQAAEDAAKALVDSLTSQEQALAQAVSGFESTISQGLTQGSDLATMWGNVTTAAQTYADTVTSLSASMLGDVTLATLWSNATDAQTAASQNLADATQAVADAQQAVTEATPDSSALTAAQNAQAQAQAQLDTAHAALLTGGPSVLALQQAQTAAASALAAANADLATAQANVASATGPTTDQTQALITAQQQLAVAEAASAAAGNSTASALSNVVAAFQAQLTAAANFSTDLGKLTSEGLSSGLDQQIAAMGSSAGDQLAQAILASGPAMISQLNGLAQQASQTLAGAGAAAGTDPGTSASALQQQFDQTLASTKQFAGDLTQLTKEGAGQELDAQIAGMGTQAGDALAQQLLAAGPAGIKALQASMTAISNVAGSEASALAKGFYGAGENSLEQLVAGMEKKFPDLKKALAPLVAQLQAMFTFTPTVVTPGGSSASVSSGSSTKQITLAAASTVGALATKYGETVSAFNHMNTSFLGSGSDTKVGKGTTITVPGFASGVENFVGGLAMVHRGEALVNLAPKTSVFPANRSVLDTSGLERKLDVLNAQVSTLAQSIGQEVAKPVLDGMDAYGTAHARQSTRNAHTGAGLRG